MRLTTTLPLLTLALLTPASAQVTRLLPTADTWSNQDKPSVNYGSDVTLSFGSKFESQPRFRIWFARSYLRFDLSNVAKPPDQARLFWYEEQAGPVACDSAALSRVTTAWTEASLTWQTMPGHDAAPLALTPPPSPPTVAPSPAPLLSAAGVLRFLCLRLPLGVEAAAAGAAAPWPCP